MLNCDEMGHSKLDKSRSRRFISLQVVIRSSIPVRQHQTQGGREWQGMSAANLENTSSESVVRGRILEDKRGGKRETIM
ncbi:MAG: hypothetical protein M1813_001731 [Trichoglossum hirsutum]|nr:MAG: hypothetical protein M1813_001731 [Trichoglossum hirsutum]